MRPEDDDENDWIGWKCKTGEKCPIAGYWKQLVTGRINWFEKGDGFPELNPHPYKSATYEYIGKKKK